MCAVSMCAAHVCPEGRWEYLRHDLRSRCAIVTASDSGIGKATAVALAQNGTDVGVTGPQAGSLTSGDWAKV